jgi:hypothetical protein
MRKLYLLLFVLIFTISGAQEKIIGEYSNEFGEKLILNPDNTFEYSWHFDLASSWNVGTWKLEKGKYLYLTINEIKDTLKTNDKIELVLSDDKYSNEITQQEYVINLISGGGQSRNLPQKKLLFKNNKLYTFSQNGKIQKKKLKSFWAKALLKPWFEKIENSEVQEK